MSFSASLRFSQARISSILVRTNRARRRLSLGSMGGFSVRKLVKPTKLFGSRPPHQSGLDQILPSQTEANIRTTAAGVLRETDATMGQELGGFDPPDGVFDQLAEFAALVVRDRGTQVLDLNQ